MDGNAPLYVGKRQTVREALEAAGPESDGPFPEHAVVTGWVCVVEWVDGAGNRWLSSLDGDASDMTLAEWTRDGLLHNRLYGDGWGDDVEDDE